MHHRDDDAHAVIEFKRAIDGGEGTYDLFAWYADSLARMGRDAEAVDWSYKSLAIVPRLVDVRGKLAKLLVAQGRPCEALSLLGQSSLSHFDLRSSRVQGGGVSYDDAAWRSVMSAARYC